MITPGIGHIHPLLNPPRSRSSTSAYAGSLFWIPVLLAAVCICASAATSAPSRSVKLPCTADTNVSSYASEVNFNYGQSSRLRLKGIEMMMLAKFDTAPLHNWTLEKASLFLHAAGPHKLRTVGISTIRVDWVEGEGAGAQANGGATFTWADFGKRRWAGPQSDFTDAALTEHGTSVFYTNIQEREGGWLEIEVPARFVEALAHDDSYGLAITDEKGQTMANNDVHSREQTGFAPYLLVTGSPGQPSLTHSVFSSRSSVISHQPPANTLHSPANTLHSPANTLHSPANTLHSPASALRPTSNDPSSTVIHSAILHSAAVVHPSAALLNQEPPLRDGKLRAWACGECEKVDPISGNLLEEAGPGGYEKTPVGTYRQRNTVWESANSTVHLSAARNEFVAFQLCVEAANGQLAHVQVTPSALVGPGGAQVASDHINLFRDWYIRDGEWYPEVAAPMGDSFSIPDAKNAIPGQRNQSLLVDLYVPHEAPAGQYHGSLRIAAEGVRPFQLPIQLIVHPFTLPDTLSFKVDLNAYGPPGDAAMELKFQRLAHLHRATLNILGYYQNSRPVTDYVPPLEGSGKDIHVSDWTAFDRRFGPYFDGSAFADLPRKGVPLDHTYLPFCEGWPSDIRQHYHYTPTTTAYPDMIVEHAIKAPPIEEAFDQQFKDEFKAVVQQFAQHFREKGWTHTDFQFYQNDKYYFKDPAQGGRGTSWWLLDEPMHRDDWLALRFFGGMFKQALKELPPSTQPLPHLLFRADISRPQWQRDWLNGLVDMMCVSGEFFRKNVRCMEMKQNQGITFWHYGTGNDIHVTNLTGEAWALKVYLSGGDGLLPWDSLGGDSSFDKPTPTTILYPGDRFGIKGPLASLRLKTFRRGQQDVEYLALLAKKKGWSRDQTAAAVAKLLNLPVHTRESFVDDAGQPLFENLSSQQFARLRESVAAALDGK